MGLAILVNFEFFFFMSDMLTMMLTCHVPGMKHSISLGRAFVPLIWKCGTGELWGWGTFDDLPSLELMGWGLSPLLRACVLCVSVPGTLEVSRKVREEKVRERSRKAGQTS